MNIKKLTILFADKGQRKLFDAKKTYEFKDKTLISSSGENSRGKTTLVRFILFSLGFNIPLTDGMHYQNYKTEIEFSDKEINYLIKRECDNIDIFKNTIKIDNEKNKYLLKIFSINSFEYLDNILGCFYIDQEKGWTLLNRGRIIGKKNFNIESLISSINNLKDVSEKIKENERIQLENRKIKILEEIKELKDETENIDDLEEIKEISFLRTEISSINLKILSLNHEKKSLQGMLTDYKEFINRLMLLQLKIKVENIIHPITAENIVTFNVDKEFILLEIKNIENQIDKFMTEKQYLEKKLKTVLDDYSIEGISKVLSTMEISEGQINSLNKKKFSNFQTKRKNNEFIKNKLNNEIDKLWNILECILTELDVSKRYIKKDIILQSKLSGISGTQLHKLTFALKLSLLILLKEKLGIEVPFIIDSPRSGEVNQETANKMIKLAIKKLPNSQIIISSVYNDIDFDKKIILDGNGVLGTLEYFLPNKK